MRIQLFKAFLVQRIADWEPAASGHRFGAALTLPLFHGGTLRARKRAARPNCSGAR